ncbi:MAG: outer membrane protein assembly factor BamD [Verrucomicrobiota bacterium]
MNCWFLRAVLLLICLLAFPFRSPAPLIFVPGEGLRYEKAGDTNAGNWQRGRAKDQLEVALAALDQKDHSTALKAARRTVKVWPLSDYAPHAQFVIGRCYEAEGKDEKAFAAYQKVLEKYPKIENHQEILLRQYQIATRFLAGQWFKLFGYIPFFPSMEKTAVMYDKIVKNGPYSEIAPKAQMDIGAAREKQSNFPLAVKAYERAADRYNDRKDVAAEAFYKAGLAYNKQARTAEYDQSVAARAIATFTDFIALFPGDARVAEAQQLIASLKSEQARGSYQTAKFYEKNKRWDGALIYYNEVLLKDPKSRLASVARERIDLLKRRVGQN